MIFRPSSSPGTISSQYAVASARPKGAADCLWILAGLFAVFSAFVTPGAFAAPGAAAAPAPAAAAEDTQVLAMQKTVDQLLAEAQQAIDSGGAERALSLYAQAIEAEPENPAPRLLRAVFLLNAGGPAQALVELEQAIDACPPEAQLHLFAGLALLQLSRCEEALAQLKQALQTPGLAQSQTAQTLNLCGVAELGLYHWDEAQEYFRSALRVDPNLIDAQANLAVNYRHRHQPDKVIDAYTRALEKDPAHVRSLDGRAQQLLILQKFDAARTDLLRAAALAEERGAQTPGLYWRLALAQWRLNDDPAARAACEKALALDPENVEARVLLGYADAHVSRQAPTPAREIRRLLDGAKAAEQQDFLTSAVLMLTDANLRAPGDDRAPAARGRVRKAQNDLARARADFDEAILAFDRTGEVFFLRGSVALELGNPHEAIVDFRRALAVREHYCPPWLGLANALLQTRRFAEAVAAYDNYLKCGEPSAVLYNNRGVANWNLNLPAQAMADFDRAIQFDPKYPVAFFNRGMLRAELGDRAGACRDLAEARRLNPKDEDVKEAIAKLECEGPAHTPKAAATEAIATEAPTPPPAVPSATETPAPTASPSPAPSASATEAPAASPAAATPPPEISTLTPTATPPPPAVPVVAIPPVVPDEPPPTAKVTPVPTPPPAVGPERTPRETATPAAPAATTAATPAIAAPAVQNLTLKTEPAGGFVAVDGRYAGVAPVTVEIDPAREHRIIVLGDKRIIQEAAFQGGAKDSEATLTIPLGARATNHLLRIEARRLQQRLDAEPDNPLLLMQMGEVALTANSFDLAERLAARAFELAPNFAYAEKALGIYQANLAWGRKVNAKGASAEADLAESKRQMKQAREHLDHALAAAPQAPWAIVAAATPFVLEGNIDGARALFERALAADPGYVAALNSLAGIELKLAFGAKEAAEQKRRLDAAFRLIEKALALEPESVDALSRLAFIQGVRGDTGRAIELAERALRIDPDDPQPFIIRATSYAALDRIEEAREDLIRALTLNPNDPDARLMLNNLGP